MHFGDPADPKANKEKLPKALPPLQVQIGKGKHDVSIRVRIYFTVQVRVLFVLLLNVSVLVYWKVQLLVRRDVLMLKRSHGLTCNCTQSGVMCMYRNVFVRVDVR